MRRDYCYADRHHVSCCTSLELAADIRQNVVDIPDLSMPPQVAAVEDVLSKSAHNYATDNTMTNDLTCSYLVLDCDSASAPSASPHRFYGTVYRPKLEMLLR